jgi:hypothetical protein
MKAIATFALCLATDWIIIRLARQGRLAGGTIPFIRRYSTICP